MFIRKKILFLVCALFVFSLLPASAMAAGASSLGGRVAVSYGSLNVRGEASASSPILATLAKDSYVTLISKSGSWWKVEYADGKYGYCHGDYISTVSGSYAAATSANLNVRQGPGTGYQVLTTLAKGDYVVVLSGSGTWKQVVYNGSRLGYVSGDYLGNSAVSLSVPSYKQYDSRWSSTAIGSETIGSAGCTTTALAMSESYRTGTTIYPNAMAKKLSYTPGGAVYWPNNYSVYTQSDYLKKAYELLSQKKTFIIGFKNSYGGQHWCVVTGFRGGKLTASNFTINDPGSSSRTTLDQLIASYPNFYKLMYY